MLEFEKRITCSRYKTPPVFLSLYHFAVHITEWPYTCSSKALPAHASKVVAIQDHADDSSLELFRNDIIKYNIQAGTEIHEEGGEGCPGIVSCVFVLQHHEGEANVEGHKADEYLSNQSNYDSYGSLLGLRLQFGSLATDEIVNNDEIAPHHNNQGNQKEEYQSGKVQHIYFPQVDDIEHFQAGGRIRGFVWIRM